MNNINSEMPEDYFATEKWWLKRLGIANKMNKPFVVFNLGIMTTYLILVMSEIIKLNTDFDEFINNLLFVFAYIVALLIYAFLVKNNVKIRAVLDVLQKDVFVPSSGSERIIQRKLIQNCVSFTKKQASRSALVGLFNLTLCISTTYFSKKKSGERKLPFGAFPTFNFPHSFEIALCYQVIVYSSMFIAYILGDLLYAHILAHTHAHLRTVQYCFKNLLDNTSTFMMKEENCEVENRYEEQTNSSNMTWQNRKQQLTEAVLYHVAVINLAKEIEELFNVITLATSTLMTLCYCFVLYHASSLSIIDIHFWKDVIMWFSASFYFAVLSFWANKVTEESQGISKACYEANFVGADIRLQKSLILVMQGSQKPIVLTVGKFADLSLITMLAVLRASYSYFMFLRQVNQQ